MKRNSRKNGLSVVCVALLHCKLFMGRKRRGIEMTWNRIWGEWGESNHAFTTLIWVLIDTLVSRENAKHGT